MDFVGVSHRQRSPLENHSLESEQTLLIIDYCDRGFLECNLSMIYHSGWCNTDALRVYVTYDHR